MGGLRRYLPITWATMWIATLAIAGVWPFAGFFSKDEIIWQVGARAVGPFAGWFRIYWVFALAAAILTAFYMTRLMVMTFHGSNRSGEEEAKHIHEVPAVMWLPLAVLAALSVVGGWLNVPESIAHAPVFVGGDSDHAAGRTSPPSCGAPPDPGPASGPVFPRGVATTLLTLRHAANTSGVPRNRTRLKRSSTFTPWTTSSASRRSSALARTCAARASTPLTIAASN